MTAMTTTSVRRETGLSRELLVLGAVVVLGTIMSILDVTIVNVAIPTLGSDFHTSISTIQWVMTGYLLSFASVIPLTGWATERFGAKRVWLVSLLLFMLGSVLSGFAWSIGSLVGFRAVQGLGGGMIVPVGQTILAQAAGPRRIGRVMSVIGVPLLLGPVFGPLIDVALFARRGFASAAATNFLLGVALFGSLILLPLYYQTVRQETPLATGLLLVPQGLGAAIAMPIAGWLTDKLGARKVVAAGMTLAMLGTVAYTQVGAHTSYAFLAAALLVIGFGLGSTSMPSMAAALQAVPRDAIPRATSALHTVLRIAGGIGTVALAIILQRTISAGLPSLHGGVEAMAGLSPAERAQAARTLADAFGFTFWVAVALIALALLAALRLPRQAGDAEEPSAAEQPAGA